MNLLSASLSLLLSLGAFHSLSAAAAPPPDADTRVASSKMAPAEVADAFYSAFARHDATTMGSFYADSEGTVFSDPIFEDLNATEARGMWQMLVTAGKDLTLTYRIESADDEEVTVTWRAQYTYARTGNKILNQVTSNLLIRDGKIVKQTDDFNLCGWTIQALGIPEGILACWLPSSLHEQARKGLNDYLARRQP